MVEAGKLDHTKIGMPMRLSRDEFSLPTELGTPKRALLKYDPELPEHALQVDKNIRRLQPELGTKFAGESVVARMWGIRDRLFGHLPTVKGDLPSQIRVREIGTAINTKVQSNFHLDDTLWFASAEALSHHLFPTYVKLIDELLTQFEVQKPLAPDIAKRFAAVVYVFGILLHPFAEGNGRTLRMTVLSYLQELCPDFETAVFPIKKRGEEKHHINIKDVFEANLLAELEKIYATYGSSPSYQQRQAVFTKAVDMFLFSTLYNDTLSEQIPEYISKGKVPTQSELTSATELVFQLFEKANSEIGTLLAEGQVSQRLLNRIISRVFSR